MKPHRLLSTVTIIIALCSLVAFSTRQAAASPNLPTQCIIYVDADATGANNGTSWANAYTSLMTALSSATAGCQLWVAAGTYTPSGLRSASFFLKDNVAIYGGFTGVEDSLSERNWLLHPTTLSGDQGDPLYGFYNVVYIQGVTSTTVLDGFIITKGNANVVPGFEFSNCGSGILIDDASPTLSNLQIMNNHADLYGGGIYITGFSTPSLHNVYLDDNTAYDGGGLYSDATGNAIFMDYIYFQSNEATHSGGGMYINATPINLNRGRFDYNRADFGAGVMVDNVATPNKVWFNELIFGTNQATSKGGGAYLYGSYANLANLLFAHNTAAYGGGIGNYDSHPTLKNVTVADNTSTLGGGAVYNSQNSSPDFRNSILWSDDGGEIYNDTFFASSTTSFTYSLVQGCNPGGAWNTNACGPDGGHNLADADPQFIDPLGINYQLRVTSPAINRGSNTLISGYLLDLVQHPRISDFIVDLGAYEFQFRMAFIPLAKR